MRHAAAVLVCFSLAGCMGGGGSDVSSTSSTTTTPTPTTTTSPASSSSAAIEPLLNEVRGDVGAGALTYDSRLYAAALRHANDMDANDYASEDWSGSFDPHRGSDGSTVGVRATEAGYNWNRIGENVAYGQSSEQTVMTAWQNSAGHRKNNENPNFEDFALAKVQNGGARYWVLVLGRD